MVSFLTGALQRLSKIEQSFECHCLLSPCCKINIRNDDSDEN